MPAGTSLQLDFDATRTRVALRAAQAYAADLARLLTRFPGGTPSSRTSATVPLEEFLAGLANLSNWPDPGGVHWEPGFRDVIIRALEDSRRVDRFLTGTGNTATYGPSEVEGLLEDGWKGDLTEFQLRDIAKLLSLGHGANFSVPGAGKTRVALALFSALRKQERVRRMLVVAPKSAYEAWTTEAATCFEKPPSVQVLRGTPSPLLDILLVNYERLGRSSTLLEEWMEGSPVMLVLDEAHRMKLGSTGVYGKASMSLAPLSPARLILTGTPAPNSARDLENLMAFVWPGSGRQTVKEAVGGRDLAQASRILRPLYARTTKHELGLPPVTSRLLRVELPPLHREIYDAMAGQLTQRASNDRAGFDALGRSVLRMLMAATSPALLLEGASKYEPIEFQVPPLEVPQDAPLHQLFARLPGYELPLKYQVVRDMVAANAAAGRKTLVWASFIRSIMSLQSLLNGFSPAVIHGGVKEREQELERFRTDPSCHVLISNPATLGEGISLHQVCHDAVYVDRDFQAGRYLQSLDRIHRLGLAPDIETRVTILVSEGTIDEVVALRLAEKLDFMGRILDDAAVQQLGDPEEAPPVTAGMTQADLDAVIQFTLKQDASRRMAADDT